MRPRCRLNIERNHQFLQKGKARIAGGEFPQSSVLGWLGITRDKLVSDLSICQNPGLVEKPPRARDEYAVKIDPETGEPYKFRDHC